MSTSVYGYTPATDPSQPWAIKTVSTGPHSSAVFVQTKAQIAREQLYNYVNVALDNTAGQLISSASTPILLNGLVLGKQFNQRIGRRVKPIKLKYKLSFFPYSPGSAYIPDALGRFMIIWDKQPNGATFALSDLLEGYPSGGANVGLFKNLGNKSRFKILKDIYFVLPGYLPGSAVVGAFPVAINRLAIDPVAFGSADFRVGEVPLPSDFYTQYTGANTDAIAGINQGALFAYLFSSAASSGWSYSWESQLIFLDD
jgi:hypothetical protein